MNAFILTSPLPDSKRAGSTMLLTAVTMSTSFMSSPSNIKRVVPPAAIPGGEIGIELEPASRDSPRLMIDGAEAQVVAASNRRVLALVPNSNPGGEAKIQLVEDGESQPNATAAVQVGTKLAGDVHPVANPAFDRHGTLFVTRSGGRGEHVPVSIYQVSSEGLLDEFSGDISNPTGIAFDQRGQMFVTSRFDGTVYRVSPVKECSVFAGDLGIATGIAFNQDGDMFVGDRGGTIFKINDIGESSPWAEHEPSVSAYHLAFGPDDALYVTGPTVSSFDGITRFDRFGTSEVFFRGLGRPQGMAFDIDGNLYVAASLRGRRGIVKISPDGAQADLVVAGMNVVGLAFSGEGEMVVATNTSVYSLSMGIKGLLVGPSD